MVNAMNQRDIDHFLDIIESGCADAITDAIGELEFNERAGLNGGVRDSVFGCLELAWKAIAGRTSGALPVMLWFSFSFSKFDRTQKERSRTLVADSYGSIVDYAAADEAAQWFGGFPDETSLRFAERWLDDWTSMSDAARVGLNGFFRDAFDLYKHRGDRSYIERLILLEQRYDKLLPRSALALPRH
jgi:hypothetical protein